ncbi:ankyrin repeat domain-containing protein [Legionella fallonii]|uniref:Ankyrin repeat protein n=1 Tax=Legionella fallonii LLAP-10 TaxID=1212491 RepID=A0A098G7S7_9GAMM|nr:ankyrin repeat domain-containing protein [Legionella fallonii]CEG57575.1 protein of unknown function [ankyrin repeat] [Legionella fallonii LLAP-10]
MKAKLPIYAVHSVDEYKNFLSGSKEKRSIPSGVMSLRTSLDEMLTDGEGDLTKHLQRLVEEDKVLLISSLIKKDQPSFCRILFPALLDTLDDTLILEDIVFHDEKEEENQWLNNTCSALIKRVLQDDDGEQLPLAHCQRIMTLAMEKIPDTLIDLPSKLAIHREIIPIPEYLHLTYKELVNPLRKNKFSGNLKLEEFIVATCKSDLDKSEYLFLTMGLLQKYSLNNEHFKSQLARCRQLYMETDYEEAIKIITNLCNEYENDIGKEACTAIVDIQSELLEVSIYENYSRRFFENRIAALYQGQCINKEAIAAINRIAKYFLKGETRHALNAEEAIAAVLILDELDDEHIIELEIELKENSTDWELRGRRRKKGLISEYQRAMGEKSDVVLTRNKGVMRSSQPNFHDELSEHELENRGPDIYYSDSEDSYEFVRKRSPFVASISGHAFYGVALLLTYVERNKLSPTKNEDINHFLKIYNLVYVREGFHSLLEVMDVFTQPYVSERCAKYGLVIDTQWPDFILEQAFKDTQEYTKQLCKQQAVGEQLSSRLHDAVARGERKTVRTLLIEGHDPNQVSAQGLTPLIIALKTGHGGITKILLDAGADPTQSLFIAIKERDNVLVKSLLQHDIDISLTVEDYDLLDFAKWHGGEEMHALLLRYLNQRGKACREKINSINMDNSHLSRLLAIEQLKDFDINEGTEIDDLMMLETALRCFFILDSVELPMTKKEAEQQVEGQPFLFMAIKGEREDLVVAALEAGADPNARLSDGCTPLFLAVENNKEREVLLLIKKDADVNLALYEDGYSPLHMAVENGNRALIEILIRAGAEVTQDSESCDSPLAIAVRNRDRNAAELLIKAGADPNGLSVDGRGLLNIAIQHHDSFMISLLLDAGAICSQNDKNNLLINALYDNDLTMVELYLSVGASANASDHEGEPAICIASRKGLTPIVETLLKAKADPDAYHLYEEEFQNFNALQMAIKNGHSAIVALLLEHEASLSYTDREGLTMVQLAKAHNHPLIVQLLEEFLGEKVSSLRRQIDALDDNSEHENRKEALIALQEFADTVEKDPGKFESLVLRVQFFINLDEQYKCFLKLLTENKIQRSKIEDVKHCFEHEFKNLKENNDSWGAPERAKKAIGDSIFKSKLKLFEREEKKSDLEQPSQKNKNSPSNI